MAETGFSSVNELLDKEIDWLYKKGDDLRMKINDIKLNIALFVQKTLTPGPHSTKGGILKDFYSFLSNLTFFCKLEII